MKKRRYWESKKNLKVIKNYNKIGKNTNNRIQEVCI